MSEDSLNRDSLSGEILYDVRLTSLRRKKRK
jgi:hypothetical protein